MEHLFKWDAEHEYMMKMPEAALPPESAYRFKPDSTSLVSNFRCWRRFFRHRSAHFRWRSQIHHRRNSRPSKFLQILEREENKISTRSVPSSIQTHLLIEMSLQLCDFFAQLNTTTKKRATFSIDILHGELRIFRCRWEQCWKKLW